MPSGVTLNIVVELAVLYTPPFSAAADHVGVGKVDGTTTSSAPLT